MITAAHPLFVDATAATLDEVPPFSIDVESYSPTFAVLRASGDLDMTARFDLIDTLDELLSGGADVVVDLAAVSFMYSGAATAVIDAASSTDRSVRVFAPTRPVRMILDVLGAGALIVDTMPEPGVSS
ncbi:MAG: STAS domain-containing protein [Rhodococcus sp. (in: high G+C Gram-positive bacteria)]